MHSTKAMFLTVMFFGMMLAPFARAAESGANSPLQPVTHDEFLRALIYENKAQVQDYIASGGDVNQADALTGIAPLHIVAQHNRHTICTALLEAGADVNVRNKVGATPLHMAAAHGHSLIVMLLLRCNATINARDRDGFTPLHLAAQYNHPDVVALLIDWGADLNARTKDAGLTPLHWAAFIGHPQTVKVLLDNGADIFAADHAGRTAYKWALQSTRVGAAHLIARRGGHWERRN